MKRLQLILFLLIMFLVPNVYCAEFNMNNYTSATQNGTKNRYQGTEIYNTGGNFTYTFGTRYNGRLSEIETYFSYPFEKNTTYRFTYNMATNDFNNNFGSSYWWDCEHNSSATVFIPTYVSYKKVQYSITPTENTTCLRVSVRGKNLSTGNITQISNWNLSSITLYDPDYQSGSGGGQGTSPTPTSSPGASNQDIINSNEHNTQDIINNNNENTSDIIDNNNENTEKIIDSMSTDCPNLINLNTLNLSRNGERTYSYVFNESLSAGTYTMTYDYYSVFSPEVQVQVYLQGTSGTTKTFVLSNSGKLTFVMPNAFNRMYFYITNESDLDSSVLLENFMLVNGSSPISYCEYGTKLSKIDETTNAINQQNEYLMDNSDPSISDNDFLNTFNSIGVSDPLSYLLTLPTQLINKIVSLSDTCTPINLGTLYGTMITLPCINIENIVGTSVWNIIDVIFSVSLLAIILKNLYDTFSNLLTMGAEKEAKEKFSMPTPMDFLSMILGGDR